MSIKNSNKSSYSDTYTELLIKYRAQKFPSFAHAHRHGADNWTKKQQRIFANDFENLLVVDDATNRDKSDQTPHEWLTPQENYCCEYGKRWERIKDKYGLRCSNQELTSLNSLTETCLETIII